MVGLLVAKAISKALNAVLERVGFDRAVERGGVEKAMANSKMDASDVVAKLIYYTLMVFVLQLAFGVFGPNPISDLIERVITFLPSLIVAIIIVVVASAIAAVVKTLIEGTLGGLSYGRTIANIASIFILFLGIVAALNQVGVGGGLIRPMQQRWEGYLTKAEEEAPRIKQHSARAPSVTDQARQAKDRVQSSTANGSTATAIQPVTRTDGTHRI